MPLLCGTNGTFAEAFHSIWRKASFGTKVLPMPCDAAAGRRVAGSETWETDASDEAGDSDAEHVTSA